MENWKQESPFLRVGLFVNSVQDRAARVQGWPYWAGRELIGRPAGRQAAALRRARALQSQSQDSICKMHFRETVDSICKRKSCKFPLKRYSFLW